MTRSPSVLPPRPPGPRLPLFGALVGPGRDPLELFTRFARRYGDVTFFRLGAERCYFVNHPQYIRDVLVVHQHNFTKSRGLERARAFLGDGLLTSEGARHLEHRRLLQPVFHRDRIVRYAHVMVEHAARLRDRWRDGQTLDVSKEMMRVTLSIAGRTLFDTDVEAKADEVGAAVTEVLESFWLTLVPGASLLETLRLPALRRAHAARARLDALIYRMIADRRSSGREDRDLLSVLVSAREADGGTTGGLTDREVRDEAMTILLAGHETTASALAWTWYLLSRHPGAEATLHAELDAVLGGRLPEPSDVLALAYTRRVATEAMRLFPPAWVIGRRAIAAYDIGPYHVPPRAMVFMSPFVMHRDARFFPDPERFDPDRWTTVFESNLPKFAYFPFGGGRRQCIGEHFAWTELVLVLATLAQRWRLALVPTHRVVPQPLITLRAKHGMLMTAHAR